MTYDNTRSLLTEISQHYFFSFIKGPMRLKTFFCQVRSNGAPHQNKKFIVSK